MEKIKKAPHPLRDEMHARGTTLIEEPFIVLPLSMTITPGCNSSLLLDRFAPATDSLIQSNRKY